MTGLSYILLLHDPIQVGIANWHTFGSRNGKGSLMTARKPLILMEAAIGIEPMNKGFAELIGEFHRVSLSVVECISVGVLRDCSSTLYH